MNTYDLRKRLISEMENLSSGKIGVDRAIATSRLASSICRTKELELKVANHRLNNNGDEETPVDL